MSTIQLHTTYFGPVQWYQALNKAEICFIDQHETFQKQTLRNRCIIATANGPQALTVPVKHGTSKLIRDIRISDHGEWRHLHWNALLSAYGHSPFFEYYADDIHPFFEKRWEFLFDFNLEIMHTMCQLLDIERTPTPSHDPTPGPSHGRGDTPTPNPSPGRGDYPEPSTLHFKPYYQVFAAKHGFLENLSILDLLFNMGPEAVFYL